MSQSSSFPTNDHRNYNIKGEAFDVGETFSGVPFDLAVDFVDEIKSWAPQGMSMAQMAMRWILDHKEVSTVITGASRVEQAIENALVSSLDPLPVELHKRLRDFYRSRIEPTICVPI